MENKTRVGRKEFLIRNRGATSHSPEDNFLHFLFIHHHEQSDCRRNQKLTAIP